MVVHFGGGGVWWGIYLGWRWVAVDGDEWWWVVVSGGGHILAGGGWCWMVVDGGGWWHSLV